jgi:hypothetical protein
MAIQAKNIIEPGEGGHDRDYGVVIDPERMTRHRRRADEKRDRRDDADFAERLSRGFSMGDYE